MDIAVAVAPEGDAFTGMCGAQGCGYVTRAWPSHEIAAERILQHKAEHETGQLMEELVAFRTRHQLVIPQGSPVAVFPDGAVVVGGMIDGGAGAPVASMSAPTTETPEE